MLASSAPAPTLLFPAAGAGNVDPDPVMIWRWTDDLLDNGSFESGMGSGWFTAGSNPSLWQVDTSSTNYGAGWRWAVTHVPMASNSQGQLVQDFFIPADATSATLKWKERVRNLTPSLMLGRLKVLLYENGGAIRELEKATGSEPIFAWHNWVERGTNLLAYAGRNLQLVIQAETYSPAAVNSWFAEVDAFTFSCDHSTMPEFQLYAGKSPQLGSADLLTSTTDLSFASAVLSPFTKYNCKLAAVRDGVTNYSATTTFTTGPRALPILTISEITDSVVRFHFLSREYRRYTIEQLEYSDPGWTWYSATRTYSGTGGLMEMEVGLPGSTVFWRLRVSP